MQLLVSFRGQRHPSLYSDSAFFFAITRNFCFISEHVEPSGFVITLNASSCDFFFFSFLKVLQMKSCEASAKRVAVR